MEDSKISTPQKKELTTSLLIKKMWRENNQKLHYKDQLSLKEYAKLLLSQGEKIAKDWFAHKKGSLNFPRTPDKLRKIMLEKQATKSAKRKSKVATKSAVEVVDASKKA